MMGKIDKVLLFLWIILEKVLKTFFWILAILFRGGVLLAEKLKLRKSVKSVSLRSSQNPAGKKSFFVSMWERFSDSMKNRSVFRRWVFIILFFLIVWYEYPPSHWGPWYQYQKGVASYYSTGFWFKKMANGDRFIPVFYTAAHKTLPFGTIVKVKNLDNGKVVYVEITDRGPFVKGRIIDLSSGAAKAVGMIKPGTAHVILYTKRKF